MESAPNAAQTSLNNTKTSQICKKACKKIHALSMVSKYVDINKRRMLMKAFLIRSYLNARWCGCFTAETLKAESIKYMKDLCV